MREPPAAVLVLALVPAIAAAPRAPASEAPILVDADVDDVETGEPDASGEFLPASSGAAGADGAEGEGAGEGVAAGGEGEAEGSEAPIPASELVIGPVPVAEPV